MDDVPTIPPRWMWQYKPGEITVRAVSKGRSDALSPTGSLIAANVQERVALVLADYARAVAEADRLRAELALLRVDYDRCRAFADCARKAAAPDDLDDADRARLAKVSGNPVWLRESANAAFDWGVGNSLRSHEIGGARV